MIRLYILIFLIVIIIAVYLALTRKSDDNKNE
jgi:hypothetical protein